jgi:thymidylate synthase (FAD)
MKLITKPSVYLLGRQQVDDAELDRFLSDLGVTWETDSEVAAEVLTETAGRVCYLSFAKPRPGGNSAYLSHIKESRHGSVCEHAVWNLLFTGVSRTLTHELVRHRAGWGYSQLSQRYVDEGVAEYVVPPDLREEVDCALFAEEAKMYGDFVDHKAVAAARAKYPRASALYDSDRAAWSEAAAAGRDWLSATRWAHDKYCRLSDHLARKAADRGLEKTEGRKFARQAARSVLPNATETKIFVTANGRALRHFLEQRGSRFAEPEIRTLANEVLEILRREAPSLFGDYSQTPLQDGTYEITTGFPKV